MAHIIQRQITDGLQVQGVDESIYYRLLTTPWGGTPTNPVVKGYKRNASGVFEDVTATVFPVNTPSISGDYIQLSPLTALVAGGYYRVDVKWTAPGNSVVEAYAFVQGET